MWLLFHVPCPTPDGRSARDLHERRLPQGDIGLLPLGGS
jgi:hypothetical protein